MSLKMAHKVILPPKKNYIPQFLKQRDINSYSVKERYVKKTSLGLAPPTVLPFRQASTCCTGSREREYVR
jgi:hypothetical protein